MDSRDLADDGVLERMRDELADIRLSASVDDVLARGKQLRRRRRTWSALGAGTAAVATAAVIAVGLAGSAAGSGNGTQVVLDAWSVVSKPGGTVSLTIREQAESRPDRVRLGQALRQAGVPAVVQTVLPRGCVTVSVPHALRVSRHRGTVTVTIDLGKLPKRAQVAVVVPAVVAYESTSHGRTEVRIPDPTVAGLRQAAAIARRHHGQIALPQVVVLGSATVCAPTANTSKPPKQ